VLLELLDGLIREWTAHLAATLPSAVRPGAAFERRAEQLAEAIATSLAERPVLCDLISSQAAVLEHNVSVEAVTKHKLAALEEAERFARLVREALPELGEDDAFKYMTAAWVMTSALWSFACPPAAVQEAVAANERLAQMNLDLPGTLADHLTTLAIGLHARAAR
jgi:hypothetical protein